MKKVFILLIFLFYLTSCNNKQSYEAGYSEVNDKNLELEISDDAAAIMINELIGQDNKVYKINLAYSSSG